MRQRGKVRRRLGVVFIAFFAGAVFLFNAFAQDGPPSDFLEELKLYSKAVTVILQGYVGDSSPRQLLYDAVKGMLSSLDRFSEFIDPQKYELLKMSMKGEYVGIGVKIEISDNFPVVKEIQPGSPAEKVGVLLADRILKADGVSLEGKTIPEVAAMLRGKEEVPLLLIVWREATRETLDFKIVREKILIEAIKDIRLVGKAIGYMRIDDFSDHTAEQFDQAFVKLKKQGAKALLMDFRDNQGGLMTAAVALAERFIPEGMKIVSVDSKIPEQKKEFTSKGTNRIPDNIPLVILVNERSASSSEIFSAAMQDYKRGTVVGMKTFGKASVQSVVPLDDVSAMKLTTARYMTPMGRMIDTVGIEPDYKVENAPPGTPGADHQTVKALELLRQYM